MALHISADALDVRALRVVLAQFLRIGVEYGVSRLLQRTGAAPDASVGMKAIVITATAEGDAQLKQQIVVQAAVERREQYDRRLIRERAAFPRCEMIHAQGKERLCHRRSFLHQCLAKLRVIV